MASDLEYAAIAVERALTEKFGSRASLDGLMVTPRERTIAVCQGEQTIEGTRDFLLSIIRQAGSLDQFWLSVPAVARRRSHAPDAK